MNNTLPSQDTKIVTTGNKTEVFLNNELYRVDYKDEYSTTTKWYKDGKLHREDGPAVIHDFNGMQTTEWYKNDILHREDGPALEVNGGYNGNEWYKNGLRHREDGPAVVYSNDVTKWYLEGEQYSKQAFEQELIRMKTIVEKSSKNLLSNIVKSVREKLFNSSNNKSIKHTK